MIRGAAAALLLLLLGAHAAAQDAPPLASAANVKAAFLFKFCTYIEWRNAPAAVPGRPLVIGVMGDDDVADELAQIVPGRSVMGRAVEEKRLQPNDPPDGVDMLFVGSDLGPRTSHIARNAARMGVLVVTESPDGLRSGSVINLVLVDDRVAFEVSLRAAERSGHSISSRMLAVARRVVRDGG